VTVFLWATKYHPFLDTPRIIDDDARQHVYWTYRLQDPELFRDDLLAIFMASPHVAPLGYQALYAIGVRLMDALLFSQLLALVLLIVSVWLFFRLGQYVGEWQGSAAAAFLFVVYFLYSSSGGLPKSFAFPCLLGGMSLVLRGALVGLAGLLVLQSVFYPPILFNTLALAAVAWWRVWQEGQRARSWRCLVALGIGTGLAAGVLSSVYLVVPRPSFGNLVTRSEARAMPEFSAQGRSAFYGETLLQTLRNDRAGIGAERLYGFVVLVGLLAMARWPARLVVPGIAWDGLWTSAVLFGLAHLVLFRMHLPSRYVLYTFPLVLLLVIAANGTSALRAVGRRWPALSQLGQRLAYHGRLCWTGVGLLALVFIYVQHNYIAFADPLTVRIDTEAMQLYRFLYTLPKDSLIAGHPLELDNVPLFAQRKVLVNQEVALPYYTGYYTEVRQRLLDSLTAYYAPETVDIERFVQHYGVDYLLINRAHFTPAFLRGTLYFEPFNSLVKQRLTTPGRFALLEAPGGERVYTRGPYEVVSFVHKKKENYGTTAR
jgi:hypothetical protein